LILISQFSWEIIWKYLTLPGLRPAAFEAPVR
jgi:hypothetical protein